MTDTTPHGFRRWRRTRPFWGGVFAVLGGAELIAIPLAPMPLVVHQGVAGVASWLIGALLVAAGALMWFQPAQRSFFGVLAVLLSLASFLTSNFGGFLVGLLLGLVGGALGFAWSPAPPPGPPDAPPAPDAPRYRSGGHGIGGHGIGAHAAPRGGRFTAFALPLALPGLLGLHLLSPSPSPSPSATASKAPAAAATPAPSASASPSPSATPTPGATPSPTASPSPSCPDIPANTSGLSQDQARKLLQELQSSKDPSACLKADGKAGAQTTAAGPRIYSDAGTLRASSLTMSGLSYDGVASLPSAAGTVKALKFSMSKAVLKDVDQTAAHGGVTGRIKTGALTLSGDVVMYTTKMSSKLLGIPLTFTPAQPPPLVLPFMVMTDVVSEQPSVTANGAQISGLGIST
ncbi:DUF6114 domain-containing protein [Actinomadura opuntiae]|uniref:DUF6114 domain-containing protein n=1 Tax=Actinomadura sp. OS1-43 TaxID=604315 RepID=UPI00255A99E8|nr:DUF6114 domain-containing protein [Actinomadura sp. OS1-43]MDL4814520.1 DUF6114 domain-containing protein [Actinomadura sp. OS1-43]